MAAVGKLSHDIAGEDIGQSLTSRGIGWMGYGEIIARSSFPFGTAAADNVYEMWKASPSHYAIMFSSTYNYVGIGTAQSADGSTWVAAIMTESLRSHRPRGQQPVPHPERPGRDLHLVRVRPATPDAHRRPAFVRRPGAARQRVLAHRSRQHDEDQGDLPGSRAWPLVRVPCPGGGPAGYALAVDQRDQDLGSVAPAPGRDARRRADRPPAGVRRPQPHQRPDPRLRRADEAPGGRRGACRRVRA